MGMDVRGNCPTSIEGKRLRLNWWHWRPLAAYICEFAPEIAKNCQDWQSNDGHGLKKEDSLALAEILQKELDEGRTAVWAQRHNERQEDGKFRYVASVEVVQEFVVFLRACGGFTLD